MSFSTTTSTAQTRIYTIEVDGVDIFYREAGKRDAPVVLLLHGFPSSSFQYRNLIAKLAGDYRVIAPDLPGFGFTKVPESRKYEYTFDNFAKTIEAFIDGLKLKKYAIYIFDYGAPVGLRLALSRPSAITAIISQNGNAFEEGFGDAWKGIRAYWADPSQKNRQALLWLTKFETTKYQYETGESHPETIPPETYHLDQALMDRPGNVDIQLDLFLNYQTNVALYPTFHEYFRTHQPPLLAIWGKNDPLFIYPGAEAYKTVLPNAQVHFVDGGHFSLENHVDEIAQKMIEFLKKNGVN
jgi:pimeloyl-ACP methyl ester carboxylesterase